MTTAEDAFVALVGPQIIHRTLAENRPGIDALGLLRPTRLAELAGLDPASIALRQDRVRLAVSGHDVRLNHQRPLLAGRRAEATFLDGHTLQSWAEKLDERVFFWPEARGADFGNSLDAVGDVFQITFNSRAFFRHFGALIDLAPINSGNATRSPARRGDWLYVPATEAHRFRNNRRAITGKGSADQACEISLRADVPREAFWTLLA